MKSSKQIILDAGIVPKLKLGIKTGSGVQSTGPHRVRFITDKPATGTDPETGKPIEVVAYLVEENGEKKSYRVPKLDKRTGEIHYLILRLAEIPEGSEVIMEMKRRGIKNYVEVIPVADAVKAEMSDDDIDDDSIPVIQIAEGDIPVINDDDSPSGIMPSTTS